MILHIMITIHGWKLLDTLSPHFVWDEISIHPYIFWYFWTLNSFSHKGQQNVQDISMHALLNCGCFVKVAKQSIQFMYRRWRWRNGYMAKDILSMDSVLLYIYRCPSGIYEVLKHSIFTLLRIYQKILIKRYCLINCF